MSLFDYSKVDGVLMNDGWHGVKPGTFGSATDPDTNEFWFTFETTTSDHTVYVIPELMGGVRVPKPTG